MTATLPTEPIQQSDRRRAARFQPAFGTVCRLDTQPQGGGVGLVRDLSESGISMFMANPPEVGAVLPAELTTEMGETPVRVSVQVVHVRPIATGDYLVGAKFTRLLRTEEMRRFVTFRLSTQFHQWPDEVRSLTGGSTSDA